MEFEQVDGEQFDIPIEKMFADILAEQPSEDEMKRRTTAHFANHIRMNQMYTARMEDLTIKLAESYAARERLASGATSMAMLWGQEAYYRMMELWNESNQTWEAAVFIEDVVHAEFRERHKTHQYAGFLNGPYSVAPVFDMAGVRDQFAARRINGAPDILGSAHRRKG